MPTKVNIPPEVQKDIKHLRRKYPAVTDEILKLIEQLENDERPGDKVPNIGHNVYKVRLPNPSAQRGKSGGFRVIYYIQLAGIVFLLRVYSKTEQTDISLAEIRQAIEEILPSSETDEDESDPE